VISARIGSKHGRSRTSNTLEQWITDDGLPQKIIIGIDQTSDGSLWLGTYNGLARFDGVSFATFDSINTPELRTTPIDAMHSDRQGRLWIITRGGHAAGYARGAILSLPPRTGSIEVY
jgi:ligand-binding sensor domain-containing protein